MKKLLCLILTIALSVSLCGCGGEPESGETPSMFVCVEDCGTWMVVYHKETKVMYAVSDSSYNCGVFTPLLTANGKPQLWEG